MRHRASGSSCRSVPGITARSFQNLHRSHPVDAMGHLAGRTIPLCLNSTLEIPKRGKRRYRRWIRKAELRKKPDSKPVHWDNSECTSLIPLPDDARSLSRPVPPKATSFPTKRKSWQFEGGSEEALAWWPQRIPMPFPLRHFERQLLFRNAHE